MQDAVSGSKLGKGVGLLAALLYSLISLLFFARGLDPGLAARKVGIGSDPSVFMWFLKWWPYAIAHRINPFHTAIVWTPVGVNLAWTSTIPLPTLVAAPITATLGPIAAYNLLMLAAPVLAAFCAFLLCRRITQSFWPSVLGGFIFGFSPYMLGQMLGHLILVLVFPIPLAVLATIDRFAGRIGARGFVASLAALLAIQFLCAIEPLATLTIFGALALALALFLFRPISGQSRIIAEIALAYLIALAIISPYLYAMFAYGSPRAPLWPIDRYSADLINLFIPTSTNLLGTLPSFIRISNTYSGLIFENGACLTIPLIVVAEAYRRDAWRTPTGKLLILMVLITTVFAFGPKLHFLGRATLPMPWAIAAHLPLLEHALPVRFAMFTFLALSIIAAIWLSRDSVSLATKSFAAAMIVIFMLPNPSPAFWSSPAAAPAFFRSGDYRTRIAPGEVILALPYGWRGSSMLWQAEADYSFRMAGGWTTTIPFEFDRSPIVNFFFGANDLPEPGEQLKAFIARHKVGAIVADLADPDLRFWRTVFSTLGIAPIVTGGVAYYPIAKGQFAPYAKLTGAELEQRAAAIRMDSVLEACATFLAQGNQARGFSEYALANARLLPFDWFWSTRPDGFGDLFVFATGDGRVQIILRGSYAALRPLGLRYLGRADGIEYPYPSRWSPDASYPGQRADSLMLFQFTAAALQAAAADLKSHPPPERPARFWPAPANPGDARREPSR